MTRIVLVRHGEVPGISPPTFRGRADLQLTDRGRAEALATATAIARRWPPAAVYTSPMRRCIDTGAAIAAACAAPTHVLAELNDIDYGRWQGLTHDDVARRLPDEYRRWRESPQLVRFPGGESLQDVAARVADALRYVTARHGASDTVVVVGHDSANRALLCQALDLPLSAYWRIAQEPCGISEIELGDGRASVARMNETGHLAQLP